MKDNNLSASLLVGIIVVLIIASISMWSKLSSTSQLYKKELAKNMDIQKESEKILEENNKLKSESLELKEQTSNLNQVLEKLRKDMIHLEMVNEKIQTAAGTNQPEPAAPANNSPQQPAPAQ